MRSKASISARTAKGRGAKTTMACVCAVVVVCLTVAIGVGLFFALKKKDRAATVEMFAGVDAEVDRTINDLKKKPANEWGPCPYSDKTQCIDHLLDAKTEEIFSRYLDSVKKYKSRRVNEKERNEDVKKNIRKKLSESFGAAAAKEQSRRQALPKPIPPPPLPVRNNKK